MKTSTKKIDWNSHFLELFTLNGNTLSINQSLDMPNKYSLIISEDSIQNNEEGLDDSSYEEEDEEEIVDRGKGDNITKYFRVCSIKHKLDKMPGRKNQEEFEIFECDNGIDIYISPYFEKILRKSGNLSEDGIYELNLKYLQQNKPIFYIEVENDGLSAILDNIVALIDKKERLGTKTYNDMANKIIELCNETGIIINSIHLEIIIRELIKSADNILERPDFTIENPEYQILRLTDSILNSNSVVTSLSFERFKEQIYKAKTYRKDGASLFDNFFI